MILDSVSPRSSSEEPNQAGGTYTWSCRLGGLLRNRVLVKVRGNDLRPPFPQLVHGDGHGTPQLPVNASPPQAIGKEAARPSSCASWSGIA